MRKKLADPQQRFPIPFCVWARSNSKWGDYIYTLYSWRALASWPPVFVTGEVLSHGAVFGTHFSPFWGTAHVKVFFAIKSLAVKCLACLWSSWLKCGDCLWSKFQPGCWAASSPFAIVWWVATFRVTVISVCLLNSWFRPRMPHRLSGPCVFMAKLWLAILRCCARSSWVRTLYWLVASIECLISQISESYGFKRKDGCEFDMGCEKKREKPVLSCMARQSQPYACEFDMG